MHQFARYLSLILLCISGVVLIPMEMTQLGWMFFSLGLLSLLFCDKKFTKDIFLIYISLALLGITPINTDITPIHFLQAGVTLTLAIVIPYCISRFVYKDHAVRFRFHHGRSWYKTEIFYIFFTALIAYLFLPFALLNTNSYLNWTVEPGAGNLLLFFIGTNALGIWDELFFISTVLGLLRRHLAFPLANLIQSILFTSFLYELGFRGWMFVAIFFFALLQGYIFKKTESLFYVITIHLTLDLVLYLALIYAHHPDWMPIFLVK